MARLDIKQIHGASQGSILFLGTNSAVSEDYNRLSWNQSSNILYVGGKVQLFDGSQQDGYILRSNSNGLGTWVAPSTVAVIGTGSTGFGAYWLNADEISSMNIYVTASGDIRYIDFDTTVVNNTQTGRLSWNVDDGTLNVGLNGDVVLQTGQEQHYYVKNQTGGTLLDGRVVSAAGTLGNSGQILVTYSIADGSVDTHYVMGLLTQTLTNGSNGYVTEFGKVRNIDTTGTPYGETWNDGDELWVSPTIPGGMTKFRPEAPNQKTIIALVIKADANGTLFVRPTFGSSLSNDDKIEYTESALTNNSLLAWNDTNNRWEQGTFSNLLSASINDYLPKSGTINGLSFSGSPLIYPLTFSTAFVNSEYAITVLGVDSRAWSISSKTNQGFTIQSNSSTSLTGEVWWTAQKYNNN